MNNLHNFIKCRTTYFDTYENKLVLQKGVFFINPENILEVIPPEKPQLVEGKDTIIFTIFTSQGFKSVISRKLELLFWNTENET